MELEHISALTPSAFQVYTGGEKSEHESDTQRWKRKQKPGPQLGKKESMAVYSSTWWEKQRDIHTGGDELHRGTEFNPNVGKQN